MPCGERGAWCKVVSFSRGEFAKGRGAWQEVVETIRKRAQKTYQAILRKFDHAGINMHA